MAFVVVYDACACEGNTARNRIIRLALARLVQGMWSEQILDELDRELANKRGILRDKRQRLRQLRYQLIDFPATRCSAGR